MLTCRDATIIRTIVPVICLGFWRYIEARIVELNPLSVGFSHAHLLVSALSIYDISKGRSEDSIANLLAHCVGQQRGIPLISHIATICAAPVKVHVHNNRSLTCADLSSETGKICAMGTRRIHHLSKGPKKKRTKRMRIKWLQLNLRLF